MTRARLYPGTEVADYNNIKNASSMYGSLPNPCQVTKERGEKSKYEFSCTFVWPKAGFEP